MDNIIELIITKVGTYNKEQGVREAALRQLFVGYPQK